MCVFKNKGYRYISAAGIQTSQNAKFYARSASFDKFSNEDKTLVVQFTVKHEQKIDCGGGYVKVCVGGCGGWSCASLLCVGVCVCACTSCTHAHTWFVSVCVISGQFIALVY